MNKSVDAPEDKEFLLASGKKLRSLVELARYLENPRNDIYLYHTGKKNDFSQWTKDVFHDEELAQKLEDSKDNKEAAYETYKHLATRYTN